MFLLRLISLLILSTFAVFAYAQSSVLDKLQAKSSELPQPTKSLLISNLNKTEDSSTPLEAEKAFILNSSFTQTAISAEPKYSLDLNWLIADKYYLYRDKIKLATITGVNIPLALPNGELHFDETFAKNLEIYRNKLSISYIFNIANNRSLAQNEAFVLTYQGCADIGICYPPVAYNILLDYTKNTVKQTLIQDPYLSDLSAIQSSITKPSKSLVQGQQNQNNSALIPKNFDTNTSIVEILANKGLFWLILSFFGFGLLLSFTPCVLPMLPIVSAMLLNSTLQHSQPSPIKDNHGASVPIVHSFKYTPFLLSVVYVLGMSFVYTLLGILAGTFGFNLSAYLQSPIFLIIFAGLLAGLAFAQFDWFSISLPSSISNSLERILSNKLIKSKTSNKYNKLNTTTPSDISVELYATDQPILYTSSSSDFLKNVLRALLLGVFSALMVGPCITAPLAASLAYIAQTGQAAIGGLTLFAMALGMGTPLLVMGAGGTQFIPKSGAWMQTMKYASGLLLLGLAWWTVRTLVSDAIFYAVFAVLLLLFSMLLGIFDMVQTLRAKVFKTLGLALALVACAYLWHASNLFLGNVSQASGVYSSNATASQISKRTVISLVELDAQLAQAQRQGQIALIDYYADWCISCVEMDKKTFNQPNVGTLLTQFYFIRVDLTVNQADSSALLKRYGFFGPPGIVFVSPKGEEIKSSRVIGFVNAERFSTHLQQVLSIAALSPPSL